MQWFASHQTGDFVWKPQWKNLRSASNSILTHNMPFDLYSIRHTCGPDKNVCDNFDFMSIPGDMSNFRAEPITDGNIESKADLLMEQYERTASLFTHNVALIPLGDDFRYSYEIEFDQQYQNYKRLMDFINSNSASRYKNATISFGTASNYFQVIKERQKSDFPSLSGDFFPYADIYNAGQPAYWSGYFTTRPFHKLLSRILEQNLRSLEILFTLSLNRIGQNNFSRDYDKIIKVS